MKAFIYHNKPFQVCQFLKEVELLGVCGYDSLLNKSISNHLIFNLFSLNIFWKDFNGLILNLDNFNFEFIVATHFEPYTYCCQL